MKFWGFISVISLKNASIQVTKFPSVLKQANINLVFKKGFKGFKENYRPVSILPVIFSLLQKLF